MDTQQALDIGLQYKLAIGELLPVKAVYLFGSYAKGNYREDSDIDIAVEVDHYVENWLEDTHTVWRVSSKIDTLIEPVLLGPDDGDNPLREEVMRTGIKV